MKEPTISCFTNFPPAGIASNRPKTGRRAAWSSRFSRSAPLLPLCLVLTDTALAQADSPTNTFRPPAVPLMACDPYFSIWSPADTLADANTVHWTGKSHRLTSLVRIDGKAFRLMGKEPAEVPALPQTSVE